MQRQSHVHKRPSAEVKAKRDRAYYLKNRVKLIQKAKLYKQKNPEKFQKWWVDYKQRNKESLRIRRRKCRLAIEARQPGYAKAKNHEWEVRNRALISERLKRKRQTDIGYQMLCRLRSRLQKAVKAQGSVKKGRMREIVGCDRQSLINHLESQFLPGMTWANRGQWHIDHKKPCSKFDLSDPDQQRACFHYTNLQPLWALDNRRKSDKWTPPVSLTPEANMVTVSL